MMTTQTDILKPPHWGQFRDTIKAAVSGWLPDLETFYEWTADKPQDFVSSEGASWDDATAAQKNTMLRNWYHSQWKEAEDAKNEDALNALAKRYVFEWGRVRRNKPETFASYAANSAKDIASGSLGGVASWSKVLSMRDPAQYAIYDARVAIALNLIQALTHGKILVWFPLLSTRNTMMKEVQPKLETLQPAKQHRVKHKQAYRLYCGLLKEVLPNHRIDIAEMVLFAKGPLLAKQWHDTNPNIAPRPKRPRKPKQST